MAKKKKSKKGAQNADILKNKKREIEQNKILKGIFIIIAFLVVGFFLFIFVSKNLSSFNYEGVDFEIVKFCDAGPPCLVTYKTTLPARVEGGKVIISNPAEKTNDYNFYLRNDPRKLDVNFTGKFIFRANMVLNFEEGGFICEGKGSIAAANLIKLNELLGTTVIRDENATCDLRTRYTFIDVVSGNETKIKNLWPACYTIEIKDCEILEGTEKFMIDTFIEVNKVLRNETS